MKRREVLVTLGTMAIASAAPLASASDGRPTASARTLLRLDSSARTDESHSKKLADVMEKGWRAQNPDGKVVSRDFAVDPIRHIDHESISGFYADPNQLDPKTRKAMAYSDILAQELVDADDLLLSIPMYNFTVPSSFKAWIDQVIRPGFAFTVDANGALKGLLGGKTAYIALAYGFEYSGTELQPYDFTRPYLQSIFGYTGLTDIHFVAIEGTAMGDPAKLALATEKAEREAAQLFIPK